MAMNITFGRLGMFLSILELKLGKLVHVFENDGLVQATFNN